MPDHFITGTDWEQSSGPIISRMVHLVDVWPQGTGVMGEIGGGDKDVLANGDHPAFAVGAKANRPNNLVGVVMTYEDDATLVVLNMADKFISRQWVANVVRWDGSSPDLLDASLALGEPVYVDDSDLLSPGCTLSRSPLNQAGSPNPLFGYIWYCQDEYADEGVGGPNHEAGLPLEVLATFVETLVCVMQVNDSGQSSL
ncbi:MAG: hypothetical protein MUP86_03195 [Dehalococcoidia bacterium]|nr:hypothetical protein [Dehalococcoidia bacterium]